MVFQNEKSYLCILKRLKMEFTEEEKKAVGSVLSVLVGTDYRNNLGENEELVRCYTEVGIDVQTFEPLPKERLNLVYNTIKSMSMDKKRLFSLMMTRLSRADGHFGVRERAFVTDILDTCEVPFVHK